MLISSSVFEKIIIRFTAILCAVVCVCAVGTIFDGMAEKAYASSTDEYTEDEIIITYSNDLAALSTPGFSSIEDYLQSEGLSIVDQIYTNEELGGTVALAEIIDGTSVEKACAKAKLIDGVENAQPNYVYRLVVDGCGEETTSGLSEEQYYLASSLTVANDPYIEPNSTKFGYQYYVYGDELSDLGMLGANVLNLWQEVQTDNTQTIAVFDTGIDFWHRDLADNIISEYAWDAYNNKPLEVTDSFCGDYNGHGTQISGVCAAVSNNGFGISGVSYNANILPVKVFNDEASDPVSSTSSLIAAYTYLFDLIDTGSIENLHIVNLSLGMYSEDLALESVLNQARDDYNILNVCAGGNGNGTDPCTNPMYPSDYDCCFSVTALNNDGTDAIWSDYNEYKDISAPGVNIYTTNMYADPNVFVFETKSGTSLAAPIVSGIAALLWTIDPSAHVEEVEYAMTSTASPVVDQDTSRVSGSAGRVDAYAAGEYMLANYLHTSVALPDNRDHVTIRQHVQLEVSVDNLPSSVKMSDINWTWSVVSGSDVVSVDDEGVLRALSKGSAIVRAESQVNIAGVDLHLLGQTHVEVLSARSDSISSNKAIISIGGPNRYSVMNGISESARQYYNCCKGVIICSGENNKWPDALCANGLAGILNYPVVLVDGDEEQLGSSAVSSIKAYLKDCGYVGEVVIVGGTESVSEAIEDDLREFDNNKAPLRLAGSTRYETSAVLFNCETAFLGTDITSVVLASGENYPDALSIGPLCVYDGLPLILSNPTCFDASDDPACQLIKTSEVVGCLIVGGENSVTKGTQNELSQVGCDVERIAGADRYETNLLVASYICDHCNANGGACNFGVASGENYPDALASAFLLGVTPDCSPLFLVGNNDEANSNAFDFIISQKDLFRVGYIIGGSNSINESLRNQITLGYLAG